MGSWKLGFWLLRFLTPHHFGTGKPYIHCQRSRHFFTASHSSNPTKLKIEKKIGPFLGIPAGVASNTSPVPNRADITSFLGRIPTQIRGIEVQLALKICCYLASWCFQTQLKNIIQIGSFPPGSRWKQKKRMLKPPPTYLVVSAELKTSIQQPSHRCQHQFWCHDVWWQLCS